MLNLSPLAAQDDSLLKYLETAAKNSPVVKQKFYEYQAAMQKVPQAGALQDPELSLGVFLKPMELVEGRQVTEATLMQMFPWFGVLRNAKDEMSLMANAKFEEFRDSKLQVFYDVQRTWYDLYKLRKNVSVSEKNIEILRSIENLALIRYKTAPSGNSGSVQQPARPSSGSSSGTGGGLSGMSGMSGGSGSSASTQSPAGMQNSASMGSSGSGTNLADLYRIKIEVSDLENSIAFLKDQERSVTARFNSLLDRPSLSPVYSADTLITDTLELTLPAISDSIMSGNPMLGMIDYEKQSYESRKRMVKGMGYPMIGLGVNYSLMAKSEGGMSESSDMNGKDMIMPMVKLTLPIYRKKYKAMQNEADMLIRSSAEKLNATGNDLQAEFYQAVQMYQDAGRRIKLYNEQYQLASKTLQLVLRNFSVSGTDLTDVLRVRQQTLDYELSGNVALADLNTAVAWIKRLMATSIKE
ncbi:MAG TPA: TolC family protein [Bacteroidales bacterium]|nr:TolC family protein [Bacteroidales bacterium]